MLIGSWASDFAIYKIKGTVKGRWLDSSSNVTGLTRKPVHLGGKTFTPTCVG